MWGNENDSNIDINDVKVNILSTPTDWTNGAVIVKMTNIVTEYILLK